jgi:sporulation protein YlmC with PRC-barrel domain
MGKLPIAIAALALMTGAASAQTNTMNTPPRPAPGAATTAPMHKAAAINPLTQEDVSKIEGTSVYANNGDKIGHISTVLMDPSSKKIDRLVVTAGGVLGVGGHRVAIPVEQFSWDADNDAFKLGTTVAELKQMPEWVEGGQQTATGSSTPPRDLSNKPSDNTKNPSNGAGDSSR